MNADRSPRAPGKLNGFQQTMLQWNELHPYNAVHVVRIPHPLDTARLQAAIETTLVRQGLTNLTLEPGPGRYHYRGGPTKLLIEYLQPAAAAVALEAEIQKQLNRRFDWREPFDPFRVFVAPSSGSFWLGLTYFHPVADAEAVVRLLQQMVQAYEPSPAAALEKMELYPKANDASWRHSLAGARKLLALPRLVRNLRRSCRPSYRDPEDLNNGFSFFSIDGEPLRQLQVRARSWQVTLNDLFLALLLQALSPLAMRRMHAGKRDCISVGCIVNTRRDAGPAAERAFGLFLGSFIITQAGADKMPLSELALAVAQKTRAIKQARLYLGMVELLVGRWLLPLFSTARRKKLYQKHYPLWGGITNMNLNRLWTRLEEQPGFDYFRAVSTGPVTPFVLSVTTVKENMNVGISYRKTVFEMKEIEQMQQRFREAIEALKQS